MAKNLPVKKILIVDDEKPIANALKAKLEKEGFSAEIAFNGEEALKKIDHSHFDLIFLDLMMPRVSGFEVLEALQARKNTAPIIISSNLSQNEDIGKAKKLGAIDYFVKSDTTLNEIVAKVKNFLNK